MTWLIETGRTASDKILRDKTFNFAKNSKYDGYERGLASMAYTRNQQGKQRIS